MADLFKLYPLWREVDPVGCPCAAGTAVFHNGLTAHGAGANMTNQPRRAMTCAYMPDGSTFNGKKNILPKEYLDQLQVGDLLNDETINPLIWKK
jgi:ectoine hydroxylase-related dioxygenase (phytanoyl-CoA dioxygenase family)